MWREMIMGWNVECTFLDPATPAQIDELENIFGVQMPEDLKELLLESNGVLGSYELGVVWSTATIKSNNLEMRQHKDYRENFMPFDHLLFFGDDGAGDYYGSPITPMNVISDYKIFCWSHEDDGRNLIFYSLEDYLNQVLHYGSDK